jgi:hydroxymethylbilane synthase
MKIKIGTRKSKLAAAQTKMAAEALQSKFSDIKIEIVPIVTHGDRVLDKPLAQIGGKGVCVTEIEAALQSGDIDIAVHSAKDLPLKLSEEMEIPAVLPRGNHRDALVALSGKTPSEFDVFTVGTGSLRRMRNLSRSYPLAQYADLRGNVDTRISKLKSGEYDAVILAAAGLERLSLDENSGIEITQFESDRFLPAPCQGIVAVEARKGSEAAKLLEQIDDEKTRLCFETEREVLRLLDADCTMPVGAFAEVSGGRISLEVSADGIYFAGGSADISERFKLAERLVNSL